MTQHKCGTCRYFDEGGFAGSGRCSHPLRKNIQQMVLVRRSELACRSDWANDLWEPKPESEPVAIASNPRYTSEAGQADDRRQFTDRVTAVSVAPSRATHERTLPVPPRAEVTTQVDEPRSERNVIVESEVDDRGLVPETSRPQLRSVAEESRDPDERPKIDIRRDLLQQGVDVERVERAPVSRNSPNSDSPAAPAEPNPSKPRRDDFDSQSWARPSDVIGPARRREPESDRREVERRPDVPPLRGPVVDQQPGRFGVSAPRLAETRPTEPVRPIPAPAPEPPASGQLPQGRSGWTEPFAVQSPATSPVAPPPARAEAAPLVVADVPAVEHVPLQPVNPSQVTRHATMKECCGTCRDFRPAEGGGRGWCNNPYAFDHRQMVEKNDLACRSTIGHWWIANDDWWMQRADIAHHGRPTPIVDDLLRQLLNWRSRRRASRG